MFPKKKQPEKKSGGIALVLDAPEPLDKPKAPKPTVEHEASETPEYEAAEEYGAKLIRDLESAGEAHGMDAETTHKVAASFFEAMARCLKGEETMDEQYAEEHSEQLGEEEE